MSSKSNRIKWAKMSAGESFCLLHQHCRSEQSAVSRGKYGQTSWTPPPLPPPSSSTLQITSVVASGAQIITLCYFSSHTLLLKSWLPGCLAASALIASRHAIDPAPLLRIWMGSGGGLMGCGGEQSRSLPQASADFLKHGLINIPVCLIIETAPMHKLL